MFSENEVHASVNAKRGMFMADLSSQVPCTLFAQLLTVATRTTQTTEYGHICVVVDQVVHPRLEHEGDMVGGDDDCHGGGGKVSPAAVMFCRYDQSTVNETRSVGQCRGTEDTGEE